VAYVPLAGRGDDMNSEAVLAKSRSNFGWAFLVLPKEQRRALIALYAFCRTVDDIVDEARDPVLAQRELDRWREILDRFPEPSVFDPRIAHDLAHAVRTFPIRVDDLRWILEGVETDLHKRRYRSFEELLIYCDGVASAVGFAAMAIFGADRESTTAYTLATGRALQLTNILRDVGADSERGRIYLPLDDLEKFQVREKNILMKLYDDRFVSLMKFEMERAKALYREAESALPAGERRRFPAAEIMRRTYELLLRRIECRDFNVLVRKVRVSSPRKMAVVFSVCAPRWFRI
jgi:15-cis-phytoene synthase